MAGWEALERAIAGEVVRPGAPDYDTLRRPALADFADARPQAVVRCRAEADVAEALGFAARVGLRVVPRSGGHCFAGRSSTDGVVIDVAPLDAVAYSDGVATVGAGARLGAVYDALEPHGVTIPAGCGPDVGIAGLTLGGGLGILGRRHGLTCDRLRAARVTLADGRAVACDATHEPDLFWALRGAGGARVGVVTSLEFETVPAHGLTCFHLVWPAAAEVVRAWLSWSPGGPDELAASLLVTASGDPRAAPRAHVFGTLIGGEAEAAPALGALTDRIGGDPEWRFCDALPFRAAKRRLAEHGPGDDQPGRMTSRSEFIREPLPDDTVAALVEHVAADRVAGEWRELDFSPWGGAYTRVPARATAFAHRDARYLLKHTTVTASGDPSDWAARSWALVHPFGTGGVYPNFPEPGRDPWSPAHLGVNLDRLLQVRSRYDPGGRLG